MELLLLRHGDALIGGNNDASRPLSATGKEQSRIVARAMKQLKVHPRAVLSSPLLRAKQTGTIIAEALQVKNLEITDYLIPGSDTRRLIHKLNTLSAGSALLVGHEPHLHAFLSMLLADSDMLHMRFGNGTLACIDTKTPIHAGKGTLRWLMNVEQMDLLG